MGNYEFDNKMINITFYFKLKKISFKIKENL